MLILTPGFRQEKPPYRDRHGGILCQTGLRLWGLKLGRGWMGVSAQLGQHLAVLLAAKRLVGIKGRREGKGIPLGRFIVPDQLEAVLLHRLRAGLKGVHAGRVFAADVTAGALGVGAFLGEEGQLDDFLHRGGPAKRVPAPFQLHAGLGSKPLGLVASALCRAPP